MPKQERPPFPGTSLEKKEELRGPELVISKNPNVQRALESFLRVTEWAQVEIGTYDDSGRRFVQLSVRSWYEGKRIPPLTLVYEGQGISAHFEGGQPDVEEEAIKTIKQEIQRLEGTRQGPSDADINNAVDALQALLAIHDTFQGRFKSSEK